MADEHRRTQPWLRYRRVKPVTSDRHRCPIWQRCRSQLNAKRSSSSVFSDFGSTHPPRRASRLGVRSPPHHPSRLCVRSSSSISFPPFPLCSLCLCVFRFRQHPPATTRFPPLGRRHSFRNQQPAPEPLLSQSRLPQLWLAAKRLPAKIRQPEQPGPDSRPHPISTPKQPPRITQMP